MGPVTTHLRSGQTSPAYVLPPPPPPLLLGLEGWWDHDRITAMVEEGGERCHSRSFDIGRVPRALRRNDGWDDRGGGRVVAEERPRVVVGHPIKGQRFASGVSETGRAGSRLVRPSTHPA